MPRYPAAVWKPIGWKTTGVPAIRPTAMVTHSDAGFVRSLQGWWLSPGSGSLSCHLHIAWDGYVEQYVDTLRRAAANVAANGFGLSVEVSNSPDYAAGRVSFNDDTYSDAQIEALIEWHRWGIANHPGIPARRCTDGVHGLGWHNQFPAWTTPGHQCPGARRVRQLLDVVYPAVIGGPAPKEPEMNSRQERILVDTQNKAGRAWLHSAKAVGVAGAARDAALQVGVTEIYWRRLGRAPDPKGLAVWVGAARGSSLAEVDARIAASSEAKARARA